MEQLYPHIDRIMTDFKHLENTYVCRRIRFADSWSNKWFVVKGFSIDHTDNPQSSVILKLVDTTGAFGGHELADECFTLDMLKEMRNAQLVYPSYAQTKMFPAISHQIKSRLDVIDKLIKSYPGALPEDEPSMLGDFTEA